MVVGYYYLTNFGIQRLWQRFSGIICVSSLNAVNLGTFIVITFVAHLSRFRASFVLIVPLRAVQWLNKTPCYECILHNFGLEFFVLWGAR